MVLYSNTSHIHTKRWRQTDRGRERQTRREFLFGALNSPDESSRTVLSRPVSNILTKKALELFSSPFSSYLQITDEMLATATVFEISH